ncbi:hypothetical protein F5Y16DRAFT_394743 [Xylariaceae sp. FL0255]|nr:hypothetical protein F5Y16DRAFT_394743 [Xylariaceae sp. FL0255]
MLSDRSSFSGSRTRNTSSIKGEVHGNPLLRIPGSLRRPTPAENAPTVMRAASFKITHFPDRPLINAARAPIRRDSEYLDKILEMQQRSKSKQERLRNGSACGVDQNRSSDITKGSRDPGDARKKPSKIETNHNIPNFSLPGTSPRHQGGGSPGRMFPQRTSPSSSTTTDQTITSLPSSATSYQTSLSTPQTVEDQMDDDMGTITIWASPSLPVISQRPTRVKAEDSSIPPPVPPKDEPPKFRGHSRFNSSHHAHENTVSAFCAESSPPLRIPDFSQQTRSNRYTQDSVYIDDNDKKRESSSSSSSSGFDDNKCRFNDCNNTIFPGDGLCKSCRDTFYPRHYSVIPRNENSRRGEQGIISSEVGQAVNLKNMRKPEMVTVTRKKSQEARQQHNSQIGYPKEINPAAKGEETRIQSDASRIIAPQLVSDHGLEKRPQLRQNNSLPEPQTHQRQPSGPFLLPKTYQASASASSNLGEGRQGRESPSLSSAERKGSRAVASDRENLAAVDRGRKLVSQYRIGNTSDSTRASSLPPSQGRSSSLPALQGRSSSFEIGRDTDSEGTTPSGLHWGKDGRGNVWVGKEPPRNWPCEISRPPRPKWSEPLASLLKGKISRSQTPIPRSTTTSPLGLSAQLKQGKHTNPQRPQPERTCHTVPPSLDERPQVRKPRDKTDFEERTKIISPEPVRRQRPDLRSWRHDEALEAIQRLPDAVPHKQPTNPHTDSNLSAPRKQYSVKPAVQSPNRKGNRSQSQTPPRATDSSLTTSVKHLHSDPPSPTPICTPPPKSNPSSTVTRQTSTPSHSSDRGQTQQILPPERTTVPNTTATEPARPRRAATERSKYANGDSDGDRANNSTTVRTSCSQGKTNTPPTDEIAPLNVEKTSTPTARPTGPPRAATEPAKPAGGNRVEALIDDIDEIIELYMERSIRGKILGGQRIVESPPEENTATFQAGQILAKQRQKLRRNETCIEYRTGRDMLH